MCLRARPAPILVATAGVHPVPPPVTVIVHTLPDKK